MSKKRHSIDGKVFKSEARKMISAKKFCQLTPNPGQPSCSGAALCKKNVQKNHAAMQRRKNLVCRNGAQYQEFRRATVPITPQMIRVAVKELQTRRAYISSGLIASHLKRRYPIENNPDALKEELKEKLNCAVSVGLISRCGDDRYCIPTLRQQATLNKTAITAFWDTYYASGSPSTMEELVNLGSPRIRGYKNRTKVSPNRSDDSDINNIINLDGFNI